MGEYLTCPQRMDQWIVAVSLVRAVDGELANEVNEYRGFIGDRFYWGQVRYQQIQGVSARETYVCP